MSHDLSLTGQSISPIQGRPNSARSSYSASSELRRSAKPASQSNVRRSKDVTGGRQRRTKPAMALEFPNASSSRSRNQDSRKVSSPSDYLSFFENDNSNTRSKRITIPHDTSNRRKLSNPQKDRFHPIPDSARSTSTYCDTARSGDLPKYKTTMTQDNVEQDYNKKMYEESRGKEREIRIPTRTRNVLQDREDAAISIQRWYKRHAQRVKSSQAALKRMLQQKKTEIEGNNHEEKLQTKYRSEEEKRKQRREKEREARKLAIEDLRKSRDMQNRINKSLAEEELAAITQKKRGRKQKLSRESVSPVVTDSQVIKTVEDKIDRIFQETKTPTVNPPIHESDKENQPQQEEEPNIPDEREPEVGKSQGLLESLLQTIEQLEAEPEPLGKGETNSKLDEKLAWIDEMQSDYQSNVSAQKAGSSVSGGGDFVDGGPPPSAESLLTKAKLNNLMEFLDNVEKEEEKYEVKKSICNEPLGPPVQDLTESERVSQLVEAEKAASQVTSEMLKLRLDVDEKTKSIDLLRKALSQQRELTVRHAQDQDKEMNQRLRMQKDQYEATVQRHLSFIDQLIDDKKMLTEKCERLVLEMKQAEDKYQKKIKQMQEGHSVELKKLKEVLSATEKLRREKWIEEKTRTIKEMTVKGLEPEIQRLITKHKQEVKKLKAIHEAELLQSDERAGQRYIRQTEELREQLEREKENACTREREMARARYEKQLEQEEMALQQQRRRLYAEVTDEKERLNQQAARQRGDIDKLKDQLEKQSSFASSALTEEYDKSKLEAERRHHTEIETLKERLELEKQAWQETYIKKQEAFVLHKERELKEAVRHDRDSEIETVIEQLEKDMQVQRDQIEKTAENRIKRIREKYESELKEIETLERQTQEKYNTMKVQYSDVEGSNMRLQSMVAHKDQEILDVKKIKDKLVQERGNVTEVIRDEFAERLVHIEEENKRLKGEVAQMRARHRLELDRVNQEKEEELAEVHKRVKAAIVKKEDSLSQIKQQHESAVKRADHLEGLLEAQRKQLLTKKK